MFNKQLREKLDNPKFYERMVALMQWYIHNLIAHPLLALMPSVGQRLHDWTGERMKVDATDESDQKQ